MSSDNVERTLGRIETMLETSVEEQRRLFGRLSKLDERVAATERWQAKVTHWGTGALAVVATMWTALKFALRDLAGG